MKLAYDKSVRTIDAYGRLHVAINPISKAAVNGYLGREIPDGVGKLGLKPDQMYQLLRDPEELAKGADTFNNIQVLYIHEPVTSAEPQTELVVGSTGTDAVFDAPYLKNTLVVWDDVAIAGIESEEQCEISSAYGYRADMTPGKYEGVAYDGVMRDIRGNHVALVDVGRAGPDVVIGDRLPTEQMNMKRKFSQRAIAVRGAIAAYLRPKLAQDAAIDVSALLSSVTAKNYATKIPEIVAAVTVATKGKLAQDADLSDLAGALDLFKTDADTAVDEDPDAAMDDAETEEEKKARMEKRAADKAAKDAAEPPEPPEGGAKKPAVDKAAMDKALADHGTKLRAEFAAIETAKREVRPIVGDVVVAMDSAADYYKFALEQRGVSLDGVEPSAYRHMVKLLPSTVPETRIAQDSAAGDFAKRFPNAARIASL